MLILLLVVVGMGITAGAALVIVGTVALGPLFWVPYLLIYLVLRAFGLTPRRRAAT